MVILGEREPIGELSGGDVGIRDRVSYVVLISRPSNWMDIDAEEGHVGSCAPIPRYPCCGRMTASSREPNSNRAFNAQHRLVS